MFGKLDYVTLSNRLINRINESKDDFMRLYKSSEFLLDSDLVKSKVLHVVKLTDSKGAFIFGSDNYLVNSAEFEFLRVLVDHFSHGLQIMRLEKKIDKFARTIDVLEYTYQRIVDNLPIGVIGIDREKQVVLWNKLMSDMFLISEKDILEKPVLDLFRDQQNKQFIDDFIQKVITKQGLVEHEQLVLKDYLGNKKVFWVLGYPLKGDGFGINGTILVFRDITKNYVLKDRLRKAQEIKEKELSKKVFLATRELQIANTELKKLNNLKSEFVSVVSHELRTPLTSIRGYAALLLTKRLGELKPKQEECLGIINSEGERLSNLINDLLDLSRLEAGKTSLHIEKSDLVQLTKDVISSLSVQAKQKNISLKVSGKRKLISDFDKEKIKQVLFNLIGNSLKFTPENGYINVKITETKTDNVITVMDNGIGISQKDLKKLFEPFSQAESHLNRSVPGSGLGLTISKHIIELHKGEIKVESKLKKGSSFSISIPKSDEV